MRRLIFVMACVFMICCGGCAVFDAVFGTNETGTPEPSLINTVIGVALNGLFPGSGAALTGLGGLYAAFRARKWRLAAASSFDAIEEHGDLSKGALKEKLAEAHAKAGVVGEAAVLAKKYKRKPVAITSQP